MDSAANNTVPLCVDLDGTLVRSDMLIESCLMLIRQRPGTIFKLPGWLLGGKANLKHQIASRVDFSNATIPYNQDVVDFVREARADRQTVLVTGSDQRIADIVAEETELFDCVRGSDANVNLTSKNKRDWLVNEFGENGFDYIGNDEDDLSVWPSSRNALVVSPANGIAKSDSISFSHVFDTHKTQFRDFLSLLRVHQWSKNGLILVPFVLDQRFGDWPATIAILLAFLAMSLLASITYIFNDMLDLQADRLNETKAKRALASGRIGLFLGAKTMVVLAIALGICMAFLPMQYNLVLLSYLLLTLLYSFNFKQVVILDVCVIAALHTLRVIAGTVAISATWSFWLLAFSMFIFFSLALAKRVAELMNLQKSGQDNTIGRDYRVGDLPVLLASGISTGFLSVLIVALYINSEKVSVMYSIPEFLWLVCPVLLYWIGRLWMITGRGEMHEDPIIFAIKDRISFNAIGLMAVAVLAAKFL